MDVGLDTLSRERFLTLTRRDRLVDFLAGIAAAKAAGLQPVKVNTVLMRGVNGDEAADLLTWALAEQVELRFIEQMPLDPQHTWDRSQMVTAEEILSVLRRRFTLDPVPARGSSPAEEWLVDGGPATVGVVGSVTRPFCGSCDRLRLTADGQLRSCLFAREETDVREVLRSNGTDEEIGRRLLECLVMKKPGHGIDDPGFLQPTRPMPAIGG